MKLAVQRRPDAFGCADSSPTLTASAAVDPSATMLRAALECIAEGVAFLDGAGRLIAVNTRFRELFGIGSAEPVQGTSLTDLGLPDGPLPQVHRGPVVRDLVLPNGRTLELRITPQRLGGWICTAGDVTAQRRTQDRLRGSEALLREALDSVDASIVVYDAEDCYVLGNRRYHEQYPHLPDDRELAGKTFEDMLRLTIAAGAFPDRQAVTDPEGFISRRLQERGMRRDYAIERLHPSGRWDLHLTRCTPSGNRVTLRVDITEQKRLQRELRQAKLETETASETKSRFLAAMSHELRTPLNPIIGFAEVMERQLFGPLGSERYLDYVGDIRRSSEHLLGLLNDILDVSRIEAGQMPVDEAPIAVAALLQEQIGLFLDKAAEQGTTLDCAADPALPALSADGRLVRQMVLNLLSNALKFTPGGRITVSAERQADGGIAIAVADTGIGIPADALGRLGDAFYQAHEGLSRRKGGTGLGIALVRGMMARHGGGLHIASEEGVGTTMTLRFPPSRTLTVA